MRSDSRRGSQYYPVLLAEVEGQDTFSTAASLQGRQAATSHLFLPTGIVGRVIMTFRDSIRFLGENQKERALKRNATQRKNSTEQRDCHLLAERFSF